MGSAGTLRLLFFLTILAGVAAATVLTLTGHDAREAWAVAGGAFLTLTGQHLPQPGS